MTTAAERAEARRKAILAKRGDRLAKLTTSARGDDATTYLQDDPPSFSKSFLGEDAVLDTLTPPRHSTSPSPSSTPNRHVVPSSSASTPPAPSSTIDAGSLFGDVDSSVWSPDLQEQFRQALLNTTPPSAPFSRVPAGTSNRVSSLGSTAGTENDRPATDPLADTFAPFINGQQGKLFEVYEKLMGGQNPAVTSAANRTKAILGLLQTILSWLLLAYFVWWVEPAAYVQQVGSLDVGRWSRWAVLGENQLKMSEVLLTFRVHPVPFFWAFAALEISFRFYTIRGSFAPENTIQSLLGIIPGLSSVGGIVSIVWLFLNDLASIVFGLGVIVCLASLAK